MEQETKEQIDATVAEMRNHNLAGNKEAYHADEAKESKLREILHRFAEALHLMHKPEPAPVEEPKAEDAVQ